MVGRTAVRDILPRSANSIIGHDRRSAGDFIGVSVVNVGSATTARSIKIVRHTEHVSKLVSSQFYPS